jgi:hypothetical protein
LGVAKVVGVFELCPYSEHKRNQRRSKRLQCGVYFDVGCVCAVVSRKFAKKDKKVKSKST